MNNVYYFKANLHKKTRIPNGLYKIKYNGKDLIVNNATISFVAESFSHALSVISEDEIVSLTKYEDPIKSKNDKFYIKDWFAKNQKYNNGDIIVFEMPSFCSGDYTAEVHIDSDGDPYIDESDNSYKGCLTYYYISKNEKMTIKEYARRHEFVPVDEKELKYNFVLEKTFDRNYFETRNCLNCNGGEEHITELKAGSWSHAKYCSNCNAIIMIYEQDRMSGVHEDFIEVWKDNPL